MKIAFVFLSNNQHIVKRIKYFLKKGHEIFYLGLTHSGNQSLTEGINYIYIESNQLISKNKFLKPVHMFHKAQSIWQITRKYDFDIIHFMWIPYCVNALFSKSKKKIFEITGSDVLIVPKKNWIWKLWYRIFFLFADAVIQDSKIAQEAGIRYGASKKNNHLIEIGVDFDIFNLKVQKGISRRRLGLLENQKFVFSPRDISSIYNIDIIIKTIPIVREQFDNVKFVFCSQSEELAEELKKLINRLKVKEHVIFTGYLDNEKEIHFFYRDADIVVSVPSSDSSPTTIYEAMACGTPTIITELPWYHGKFIKNRELSVVPVRDIKNLASSIIGILKNDIKIDTDSAYLKVYKSMNLLIESKKLEALYKRVLASSVSTKVKLDK